MTGIFKKLSLRFRTLLGDKDALLKRKLNYSSEILVNREGQHLSGSDNENATDELWGEFKGKENSEEVMSEKSCALAEVFVELAWEFAVNQHQIDQAVTKSKYVAYEKIFNVFLETVFLYMNAIDRVAFIILSNEKRSSFMNRLKVETLQIVFEMAADEALKADIGKNFINMCNKRQQEYGAYKITSTSDENVRGTLFWEYGRKIAKITAGTESSAIVILETVNKSVSALTAMDFQKLLSENDMKDYN